VNFYDPAGRVMDHRAIEEEAGRRGISIRTGCFCNPGAHEAALGLSPRDLSRCLPAAQQHLSPEDFGLCVAGGSVGAVRASLGLVSNQADVERYLEFARGLLR
jgi:selenocysteine lyase/cysteine desulfurase